jgi:hypothetical protein
MMVGHLNVFVVVFVEDGSNLMFVKANQAKPPSRDLINSDASFRPKYRHVNFSIVHEHL